MKKKFYLLLIVILFSSCSIYEEIYFNEDMTVKYEMKFDASEWMSTLSASSLSGYGNSLPNDSVISLAEIMSEHKDTIQTLSLEEQQILNDLKPLNLRINNDTIANTFFISLYGNFANAESLNRTFKTLSEHKDKAAGTSPSARSVDQLDNASRYFWDGKTMKREIDPDMLNKLKENTKQDKGLMDMFMGGKMIVKYHFPKRVINVSNPNALYSQDGKTVVIEYPATDFVNSAEKINVEITTE